MAAALRPLRAGFGLLKKTLLVLLFMAVAVSAAFLFKNRSAAPTVPFVKTTRQTLSNQLSTNGKVEPADYMEVRVESPGLVKQVLVHNGDSVRKDKRALGEPQALGRIEVFHRMR